MALPFPSFQTWLWKSPLINSNPNPNPNPNISPHPPPSSFPNSIPNSSFPDSFAALDVDVTFNLSCNPREKQSSRHKVYGNARRKVNKRRNQSLDLDFDMVVVQPADYFSGSESEGSDWSVGWFEPHAAEFCSDNEPENSFAVLVPCYGSPSSDSFGGKARFGQEETVNPLHNTNSKSQLWAAVLSNLGKDSHAETNFYLQQWVSSLQT